MATRRLFVPGSDQLCKRQVECFQEPLLSHRATSNQKANLGTMYFWLIFRVVKSSAVWQDTSVLDAWAVRCRKEGGESELS